MTAEFDPFVSDDFSIALKTESVSLPLLNDFAQAYAGFDFRAGTGEVVSELKASDGTLNGYIKPLFKKVDILDWQQDAIEDGDGLFQLSWEGLSGGLTELIYQQRHGQSRHYHRHYRFTKRPRNQRV